MLFPIDPRLKKKRVKKTWQNTIESMSKHSEHVKIMANKITINKQLAMHLFSCLDID